MPLCVESRRRLAFRSALAAPTSAAKSASGFTDPSASSSFKICWCSESHSKSISVTNSDGVFHPFALEKRPRPRPPRADPRPRAGDDGEMPPRGRSALSSSWRPSYSRSSSSAIRRSSSSACISSKRSSSSSSCPRARKREPALGGGAGLTAAGPARENPGPPQTDPLPGSPLRSRPTTLQCWT